MSRVPLKNCAPTAGSGKFWAVTKREDREDREENSESQIVTFSGANRAMEHDVDDLIHRVYWSVA